MADRTWWWGRRQDFPFNGDPPRVGPGDRVLCRTAFDEWVPMVALAKPRYDRPNAIGPYCYLTVLVSQTGHVQGSYNWPAEDVRRAADEVSDHD